MSDGGTLSLQWFYEQTYLPLLYCRKSSKRPRTTGRQVNVTFSFTVIKRNSLQIHNSTSCYEQNGRYKLNIFKT